MPDDEYDTAISFYAPGRRRRLEGWRRGSINQRWEDELASMAAAKTEESVEDLLGGEEVCGAEGCRAIGIAPEGILNLVNLLCWVADGDQVTLWDIMPDPTAI